MSSAKQQHSAVTVKVSFFNFYSARTLVRQLAKIRGIGILTAQRYLLQKNWPLDLRVQQLSGSQLATLEAQLNLQMITVGDCQYRIHNEHKTAHKLALTQLKKYPSVVGLRHKWGLSVRGQRTRSTGRRNKKLILAK